jgi:hypothetical protein
MNITSTITANPDHSMMPSEASGKRKASDDNSQNPNSAPKSKRTRKDVSSLSLSVLFLLLKCHGTECRLPQAETYAITYLLLWSYHANTPSHCGQFSTAKSSVVVLLLSVAPNPNSRPLKPPPIIPMRLQVHPIHPTRNSVPTPQRHLVVRASTSRLMRMARLKRTSGVWRWRPMPFDAPHTAHATRYPATIPFSHSHHAKHPKSNRIVQCVVKARAHLAPRGGRRCPPAASV